MSHRRRLHSGSSAWADHISAQGDHTRGRVSAGARRTRDAACGAAAVVDRTVVRVVVGDHSCRSPPPDA